MDIELSKINLQLSEIDLRKSVSTNLGKTASKMWVLSTVAFHLS